MTSIEKIKVGNPIRAKDHVLIPIERTSIRHSIYKNDCWYHGSKQLIALVVKTVSGIQVIDVETGPITISELKTTLPELQAYLK